MITGLLVVVNMALAGLNLWIIVDKDPGVWNYIGLMACLGSTYFIIRVETRS